MFYGRSIRGSAAWYTCGSTFIPGRDSNIVSEGSSNDLPSVSCGDFDQAESGSIILSDSDHSQECTEDGEVDERTGESENQIQTEETTSPYNRDVISTTDISSPAMPDDLSSIGETVTHAQHIGKGMHPSVSSGDFD